MVLSQTVSAGIHLGGENSPGVLLGLDLPPQEEFDTPLPAGGELALGRRWGARSISLPVVIHADTLDALEAYRRELATSFNPARGEGVLVLSYPNGDRRRISAQYSSGLDVAEKGRQGGGLYYDLYTIILKARDPFPYGDQQELLFNAPEVYEFFAPPGDPENVFYISSGTTTGDSTIIVDSEVDTWPVWQLGGPITSATLRNRDTGKTLTLSPNLSIGETLIVRMDPRTPARDRITKAGVNVWVGVAGNFPVFWSLQPGSNRITIVLNGTTPDSYARMTYRPRYLVA